MNTRAGRITWEKFEFTFQATNGDTMIIIVKYLCKNIQTFLAAHF